MLDFWTHADESLIRKGFFPEIEFVFQLHYKPILQIIRTERQDPTFSTSAFICDTDEKSLAQVARKNKIHWGSATMGKL